MEIGTPLHEALNGNEISVHGSSGAPFSANVLQLSGFDVTQGNGTPSGPAPTSGIAGLVLNNRPTPSGM